MGLEQIALLDNVLTRLERLENALNELNSGVVTLQEVVIQQEPGGALNGWIATGSAFRDLGSRVVLDASLPGIVVASGGIIKSADYASGVAGFKIDGGVAEFNNVTVRGTIHATSGSIAGWYILTDQLSKNNATLASAGYLLLGTGNDIVRLDAADTTYRLWIGNAAAASAPFRVTKAGALTATNANITGTIMATSGAFTGTVTVGSSAPYIQIDGPNQRIRTSTFATGLQGFSLEGDGSAEFANVSVRGEIHAAVLAYGEQLATSGTLVVAKAAGKLRADVTTVASPTTFNVEVEDPDTGHVQLFAVGDVLRLQDATRANWVTVQSISDQTTFYRYVCVLSNGTAGTFRAGAVAMDYGQSGQGVLLLTADQTNAPFYSVRTHAGSPWSAETEVARLGNLNGNWGYGAAAYGLALGEYAASKANLTWDPTNGLRLRTYSTTVLQLDQSGNADITGKLRLSGTGSALAIGATPPTSSSAGTGIWIDRTGIYTLDSGVNEVWLSTSDGCLYAGTDIRLSNGMIRIRDASPAATIAWRNATDTDYIGYLLSVFGGVGIGFAFNDADGYFFSDADARIGGGLYVGGTGTNPAAGYVEALYDVMPYGTKRGVWRRFVEVSGNAPTDHFTSGRITSGYAWAGSPFATPSIRYSYSSDYLGFYNSGPGRYFMYKSITNNSTNWRGMYIEGRLCAGVNGSVGLRVDDGTDNNYAEIYVDNTAADGANTIKFSQRTGGGAVTTATAGCKPPISQYMVLRLLCHWDGSSYSFFAYIVDESGYPVNVGGFNTAAVAWCPASGRAGIVGSSSAACGYQKCDWFYNCFS